MMLDGVLQLLQEGQIRGLPRAETLLILGEVAEGEACIGGGAGEHRRLRGTVPGGTDTGKGQIIGILLETASRPSQHLTPHAMHGPAPAQPQTLALYGQAWREGEVGDVLHNTRPLRSRGLTKMEMMPLNFSSTRSQMILLLKYWTGSH